MATGNITRLEGVWPETHERAVRDSAGVNLETKLGNINSNISQLDQKVNVPVTTQLVIDTKAYISPTGVQTNSSNFRCSGYIPVREGDILILSLAMGTTYPTVAGYDSDKTFVANITMGTNAFETNKKVVIPSGYAYVRVAGRATTHDTHPAADPSGTITRFDKCLHESDMEYTTLPSIYTTRSGYIRKDGDVLSFSGTNTFKVSNLIPIRIGMVIESNTTFNSPYSQVVNAFYGASATSPEDTPMAIADFSEGGIKITQAHWDAGYRYLVISFQNSVTPEPYIKTAISIKTLTGEQESDIVELRGDMENKIASIRIHKHSDTVFHVIVPNANDKGVVRYVFEKRYKKWDSLSYQDGDGQTQTITDFVSCDVWNNEAVYKHQDDTYICQGNANFIYKATDEANHAGDGHGCEVMKYVTFLADGIEIDPVSLVADVRCQTLRCVWRSEVYKSDGSGNTHSTTYPVFDTSGNPVVTANHYLDMLFEVGNKITIDNRLIIKRPVTFTQCHGAMLECYYGDFNRIAINDADSTVNSVDSEGAFAAIGASEIVLNGTHTLFGTFAEMWGEDFYVSQRMTPLSPVRVPKANLRIVNYDDRTKVYFMPAICTDGASSLSGNAESFNAGDTLQVICERTVIV